MQTRNHVWCAWMPAIECCVDIVDSCLVTLWVVYAAMQCMWNNFAGLTPDTFYITPNIKLPPNFIFHSAGDNVLYRTQSFVWAIAKETYGSEYAWRVHHDPRTCTERRAYTFVFVPTHNRIIHKVQTRMRKCKYLPHSSLVYRCLWCQSTPLYIYRIEIYAHFARVCSSMYIVHHTFSQRELNFFKMIYFIFIFSKGTSSSLTTLNADQ